MFRILVAIQTYPRLSAEVLASACTVVKFNEFAVLYRINKVQVLIQCYYALVMLFYQKELLGLKLDSSLKTTLHDLDSHVQHSIVYASRPALEDHRASLRNSK